MVDTAGFFEYPVDPQPGALAGETALFANRSEAEWDLLLAYTQVRRFRPGEVVLVAGDDDRALYVLVEGRLEAPHAVLEPVAAVGIAAFVDGLPRAVTVRALDHGEVRRLSFSAFESLSAREPHLGRELLIDIGRMLAAPLRAAGGVEGWSG